jgi:HEAT repeat protein
MSDRVEELIASLSRHDWHDCKDSVESLGKIGDVRAVETLIETLRDKYGSVRDAAAEALVKIDPAWPQS